MSQSRDERFVRTALALARRARGQTSPNPLVGAVVVKAGHVVGKGYHRRAGGPHAEVLALEDAGPRARGATLYVTLEPCCHTDKRTPPCTDAILGSGIGRVVVGMRDPNPRVSGKGLAALRAAGLATSEGVLEPLCRRLNEFYLKHTETGLPFVILKLAASLDGRIASRTGRSQWITGEKARRRVHEMRSEVDAVMVGIGTALADDPQLTVRLPGRRSHRNPLRVVLDPHLRIPRSARLLAPSEGAGVLVFTGEGAPRERAEEIESRGASVVRIPAGDTGLDLTAALRELGRRGCLSVMIEGGAAVATSALRAGVADRLALFLAPRLMGDAGGVPAFRDLGVDEPSQAFGLEDLHVRRFGADLLVEGRPVPRRKVGDCGEKKRD